jgi:hypothetical protein
VWIFEPPPMKKYKNKGDPAVDEACGLLKTVKHNLEKSDRFSIFGEYVASRVRDLNNSQLQSIVQHRINTILFEAEMELHNLQTHSLQTPLTIHLDSEPSPASHSSCNTSSTPTPQSDSNSSTSNFQIIASVNPSS